MKVFNVAPMPTPKHAKRMLKLLSKRINAAEARMADVLARSIDGKPPKAKKGRT